MSKHLCNHDDIITLVQFLSHHLGLGSYDLSHVRKGNQEIFFPTCASFFPAFLLTGKHLQFTPHREREAATDVQCGVLFVLQTLHTAESTSTQSEVSEIYYWLLFSLQPSRQNKMSAVYSSAYHRYGVGGDVPTNRLILGTDGTFFNRLCGD